MSYSADKKFALCPPPPPGEPDSHGQAALILVESLLHALVEMSLMTTHQAIDVVSSAQEVKKEVARLSGESEGRMRESLELLGRIASSIQTDLHRMHSDEMPSD